MDGLQGPIKQPGIWGLWGPEATPLLGSRDAKPSPRAVMVSILLQNTKWTKVSTQSVTINMLFLVS